MRQYTILVLAAIFCFTLIHTPSAYAHEVYVLDSDTIAAALEQPPLQVFAIIFNDTQQFFFWFFLTTLILVVVAFASVSKRLEHIFDPYLLRLKRYAPLIGRVTLGLSVCASAYYSALFGPELPLSNLLPQLYVAPFRLFLAVVGVCVTIGYHTRIMALFLIGVYAWIATKYSVYVLTYANYLGEMLIAFTVGGSLYAFDKSTPKSTPKFLRGFIKFTEEHAFLFLRIGFGVSLIYASMYAKFFHAQLAITTVIQYNLTDYFPFSPEFIVLGAFAIEILLGVLFIIGIEIRFAAIFLTIFLILSLVYFKEAVWPHLILAGGAMTIFAYGYGPYTLERLYLRRHHHKDSEEPVF
jgi:uncharacterized membrane protein YphA (DoxX/SURF4 family)